MAKTTSAATADAAAPRALRVLIRAIPVLPSPMIWLFRHGEWRSQAQQRHNFTHGECWGPVGYRGRREADLTRSGLRPPAGVVQRTREATRPPWPRWYVIMIRTDA